MADNLRAWRNAAHELPPEGVPVYGILADGTGGWYERARDDDGNGVWAESERIFWDRQDKAWSADGAYYDDDYRVRYWHPLPDVPTLAELDAHRDERAASVAATAAASERGGAVIQREDVTVHDGSTTEDICGGRRIFVAELRLRTAYAVDSVMYQDVGQEWIESVLRTRIMHNLYGDLPDALAALETALGVAGHRDGFGSPVKDALGVLRSHVATLAGGEGGER